MGTRLPSPNWLRTLDRLLELARLESERLRHPLVVERSGGSEARYLHVRRNEVWYGVRIAAHMPFYPCSRDYFQVLLEEPVSPTAAAFAAEQIPRLIRCGGSVVESPFEVLREIDRIEARSNGSPSELLSSRKIARLRHQMNERARWRLAARAETFATRG